jgi:DNA-binding response OmpR family regulator
MKALVVDDDLVLADVIAFTLRRAGFEVSLAHDGLAALEQWRATPYDIIILDLNLPKLDGLSVCQRIRAESDIPILILSVRGEEDDVVRGLDLGADDYVVKPFSPRQLVARIHAVLRRSAASPTPSPLIVGDLTLDVARHEVRRPGQPPIQLTPLESRLLETLMRNSGHVLPSDTLISHVWGSERGDRVMLKQLVKRLRSKIEPDPSKPTYLETVPGVGYALIDRTSSS